MLPEGRSTGAVVKTGCMKRRTRPPLSHSGSKETEVFSPLARKASMLWGRQPTVGFCCNLVFANIFSTYNAI